MNEAIKLNNNRFWDSTGIVHNKKKLSEILNLLHPIGEYYETSNIDFDPNVSWGGTWELEKDGTVLVSQSEESNSIFNDMLGTVVGEEKHTQTIAEMARHYHRATAQTMVVADSSGKGFGMGEVGNTKFKTDERGESKPFNIVQPSKIVNRWHRIA